MRSAARFMSALLTATLLLPSLLAAPAAAFTTTDPDWSLVDATSPISVDVGSVTVIVVLKQTGGADVGASDGTVTLAVGGSATLTSVVDNGDGTYTSTLSDTTAESVTVHGKIDGTDITDEANVTFSAGALDHIVISPSSASKVANAGQAYTAAGRDQFNNPTGDETGSTTFTIGGSGATCAVNVCKATIAGAHTVTGDDGGLRTHATLNVTAAAADHLSVGGFTDPTTAGAAHTVTVTARDSFGNLDTGYTGTVHITSSDPAATLPGNHVYVGGDGGTHGFSMTLNTQGTQSITATDVGTPSINGSQGSINVNAGAVTHLAVTGFADPTIAGVAHTFTVTAQDVGNNTDTTYTGTVHFTSSDGSATLPSNYTFVAGDNGTHTFTLGATLQTSGTQSITATDTGTSSINGAQSGITVNADVAVTLIVSGFTSPTIAGATHSVTVEAQDQFGNTATGYTGTVHFTSTDGAATLPSNYTFVGGDAGTHTFAGVILRTVGSKSITATDIGTPSINGTQSGITVNPGAATHYAVTGFSPGTAGTSDAFSVTVLDAANNTVTGYTGTVHFTSSDGAATLPTNYTFVSGDAGTRLFAATFDTAGTQSITATDTVTASITGSQSGIVIDPAAATHFSVAGFNNPTTAGVSDNFTVTALDAFGNTATGYAGTVHVTSNDGAATLPANSTLTLGTGSFSATLRTSGTRSITATDTVSGSITGAQTGILVNAGTATHFSVTGFNDPAVAGVSDGFIVTALDGLDNIATGYTGQVHFTSSDGAAALPADSTLTSGVKAFTGILKTAGVQSITATDTIAPSITGSQSAIDVTAAAANHLVVSGYPGSTVAGVPHNVTVTAEDAFNNTDLAFAGLVTVTATGGVTHVTPSVATALSSGVGTFSVTFDTVGIARQISAAASGVTTGSQAGITVTPGAATHFSVTGFGSPITAGVADDLVVTALDALNNTATGYTGTVHLTSSDGQAVLTANHTFTGGELGVHTFVGSVLKTAGTQSITATDTVTASINGTQSGIVVNPAAADHLTVTGYPSTTVAGDAHNLTVTALDPFDNTDTNYVGTVHFTSTDALGPTLPGNYTFLAGDAGDHLFTGVALHQAGTRSITATDTLTASITGIQSGIVVSPGDATDFAVTSFDDPVVAGVSNTFDVVALDAFGNQATGYTGTMTFASSDPAATLPSDTTMTNGDGSFLGTLRTVGVQSITVTDTISNLITGSQTNIDVTPAVTDHFSVTGYPSPTLSNGVSHNVTVTARDAFDNITPAYAGTVHITSSDGAATLPANATLINGVRTFSVTLNTSGNQSITATDTVTASITGAQINIAVDPGPVDHVVISPSTASILATETQLYLAEGFDAGNNDLGDFTSVTDFSIVGGTCVAVPVSGPNNTCSAVTVGNHTVTGHELTDDVSDTAILTILNTDPVAVDDTPPAILEDAGATTIDVLANDTDVNLDTPLLITGATDGALGTVTVNVDGSDLTYTPDADANGSDTFTYDISDGNGGTARRPSTSRSRRSTMPPPSRWAPGRRSPNRPACRPRRSVASRPG